MICPLCGYSKREPDEYNPKNRYKLVNQEEDAKPSFVMRGCFDWLGAPDMMECPSCHKQFEADTLIKEKV